MTLQFIVVVAHHDSKLASVGRTQAREENVMAWNKQLEGSGRAVSGEPGLQQALVAQRANGYVDSFE